MARIKYVFFAIGTLLNTELSLFQIGPVNLVRARQFMFSHGFPLPLNFWHFDIIQGTGRRHCVVK